MCLSSVLADGDPRQCTKGVNAFGPRGSPLGRTLPMAHASPSVPCQANDLVFVSGPKRTAWPLGGLEGPSPDESCRVVGKHPSCFGPWGDTEPSSTQSLERPGVTGHPLAAHPCQPLPLTPTLRSLHPGPRRWVCFGEPQLGRPQGLR